MVLNFVGDVHVLLLGFQPLVKDQGHQTQRSPGWPHFLARFGRRRWFWTLCIVTPSGFDEEEPENWSSLRKNPSYWIRYVNDIDIISGLRQWLWNSKHYSFTKTLWVTFILAEVLIPQTMCGIELKTIRQDIGSFEDFHVGVFHRIYFGVHEQYIFS